METIEFNGMKYPAFQSNGNAARFCLPFALEVCKGIGYDIGYGREEWKYPGAIGIDILNGGSALDLPEKVDYIFSSHCLEHLPNWVDALRHWEERLKSGGHIFLYLPDYSQEYWRPYNNRKHIHIFTPQIIRNYFATRPFKNVFVCGVDLYNSFMTIAEKR